METRFTLAQLADPNLAVSEKILRSCVHCGFCISHCPTYMLLGDELDSPRGRIYLIKDMLENDRPASPHVVKHLDRCLSCLACMSTCPSGVNYMHLVDHARLHVEKTYKRPVLDRLIRSFLVHILPKPKTFRALLKLVGVARIFSKVLPRKLGRMLSLLPNQDFSAPIDRTGMVWPAEGKKQKRVVLLPGCVQQVLAPQINAATVRMLTRLGCEVVIAKGSRCCGALANHLGHQTQALNYVRANVDALDKEINGARVDAIIINASGCGTALKDYGFMLRTDPTRADVAKKISGLARDVSEYIDELGGFTPDYPQHLKVTYQSACSLQHGQEVKTAPVKLLTSGGFTVAEPTEAHLCCGSAGTYNITQPEISDQLRRRKVENIVRTSPDLVATGNVGCLIQLQAALDVPIVHTVELLDWVSGGPTPKALGKK